MTLFGQSKIKVASTSRFKTGIWLLCQKEAERKYLLALHELLKTIQTTQKFTFLGLRVTISHHSNLEIQNGDIEEHIGSCSKWYLLYKLLLQTMQKIKMKKSLLACIAIYSLPDHLVCHLVNPSVFRK